MNFLRISAKKDYLLVPDAVWDCSFPQPAENHAILVSDGFIKHIRPVPPREEKNDSAGLEIITLPGITLMPGLVDCHVHLAMDCENLFQAIDDWEHRPDFAEQRANKAAFDYLLSGVMAVRDGGDKAGLGLKVRKSVAEGTIQGPEVVATGLAVYKKGKYGAFLGPGIETPEEGIQQVKAFAAAGIDQLKVVVSGLVSFKDLGVVGPPQFTVQELKPIVDEAHRHGLKVMAHASSAQAVDISLQAGVDSVEHGYFLETWQLKAMAARGTAWIPTLAPLGNLISHNHLPYEGADMDVIRKSFDIQLTRINEAVRLGVNLGIGTDAGANHVFHGISYHDELKYYAKSGLDNRTILRMATSVSANIVGLGQKMGALAPGKKPYLIGVSGNPLNSLDVLKAPAWIIMPEIMSK